MMGIQTSKAGLALAAMINSLLPSKFTGYTPPKRVGPKPEGGAGASRARKRLADKLKANQSIPDPVGVTRQMARTIKRQDAKRALSERKKRALSSKVFGGAAVIR